MLAAMRALFDADFHVVNSIGTPRFGLLASTKTFSDEQLEVFNAHLSDHPSLWIVGAAQNEQRAVSARWSDRMSLRQFRNKALYQDFFRLVGTRHQLGGVIPVNRELTLGFSFNRSSRDFCPADVHLLDLLLAHARQLTLRIIGQMEVQEALALREQVANDQAVMVVDTQGALLFATESARQLARDYFATLRPDGLPAELHAWLRQNPAAEATLARELPGRQLTCTCGPATPRPVSPGGLAKPADNESQFIRCIYFTELCPERRALAWQKFGLTPREAEVLHWMAEGKRNSEIAIILGISERTVGKHRDHLFTKLGVETRTAAVATVHAMS